MLFRSEVVARGLLPRPPPLLGVLSGRFSLVAHRSPFFLNFPQPSKVRRASGRPFTSWHAPTVPCAGIQWEHEPQVACPGFRVLPSPRSTLEVGLSFSQPQIGLRFPSVGSQAKIRVQAQDAQA